MSENRQRPNPTENRPEEASPKRVVVDDFPASELPDAVRGGIDPSHRVRIVVDDRQKSDWQDFIEQVRAYQARRTTPPVTREEAVARIRALRDEWD